MTPVTNPVFTSTEGLTIILDFGEDISTATSYSIKVQNPDQSTASWAATIPTSSTLQFVTTSATNLSASGTYYLQGYIEMGVYKGRSSTVALEVYPNFTMVPET